MMEMLATLVLFALISLLLLQIFGGEDLGGKVAFAHAYPLTQKLASIINFMSASPQNESAIIAIEPFNYRITFDTDTNYIKSYVSFLGKSEYGLYLFPDIELTAPEEIKCEGCKKEKKILIEKKVYGGKDKVEITVSELP